jgi:protein tyrosine/serine phosphatase
MRQLHGDCSRRRNLHSIAVLCTLLLCPVVICRAATEPARNPTWAEPIDKTLNLYRVAPTLYRSAQFNKTQAAELERLGIRTSVDLREFGSDSGELNGTSIKQIRVRTNTWSIGDRTVIEALAAIHRAEADGPVLLHCQHGADRTGLVTAMYRIVYQGWTKEAALDELFHGGYGYHSMWKNIPSYIKHVDVEKIKDAVGKELAKNAEPQPAERVTPRDISPIESIPAH